MKRIFCLLAAVAALSLAGCASVLTGLHETMTFDSAPPGATVKLNGEALGQTPLTVGVRRESDAKISIEKDGFQSKSFDLPHRLNRVFWANIVVGGVIGSTTDLLTGATVEYEPDHYYTVLTATGAPLSSGGVQDHRTRVLQFIVLNYQVLGTEFASGASGEHVTSLLDMLQVTPAQRANAIELLKDLYSKYPGAPAFGDAVASRFAL